MLPVMKAKIQIVLGLVVALLVLLSACQTGDFNMLKEKVMMLKSITRLPIGYTSK